MTFAGTLLVLALILIAVDILFRLLALDDRNQWLFEEGWMKEVPLWCESAAWAMLFIALWAMPRSALIGS